MINLAGKTAVVFGLANKRSIAWGIAQKLHEEMCIRDRHTGYTRLGPVKGLGDPLLFLPATPN